VTSSPPSAMADRLIRVLAPIPWVFLGLGAGVASRLPGGWDGAPVRTALVLTLTGMFGSLIVRLVLVAAQQRSRRLPLGLLAVAIATWAAGSASVSAEQTVTAVTFPAPGEVLCLGSYLGLAAFLLLDVPRRTFPTKTVLLESSIVCGAAVCLASVAVLTPVSMTFQRGGLALLLAMLFPLINVMLAALVLAQVVLRRRARSVRTLRLLVGFLAIAVADSSFIVSLSNADSHYSTNLVLAAVWGAGFAAITAAACTRPVQAVGSGVERTSSRVLAAAAGLAVVVLVIDPSGPASWWVEVPAILTLVCTGLRLMLALTEARGAAAALQLSLTDELTGLSNRRAIMAVTDRALASRAPFAVLLLDFDGFKDVNDSLGHAVGDEVLVTLAHRLQVALGGKIAVARLGGDEFALVALGDDVIRFYEIARHARAVLREPLRVQSMNLSIEASVGIAIREAFDTSTELLRRADIAMYEAKNSRAGVLLFDRSQDGASRKRLRQGDALRHALAEGRLEVWYQPQVDARTERVVGMEALVRLRHPVDGLLSPISFLPEARQNGLMPALTEAVMDQVIADARRWSEAGFTFTVAMNWAPPELVSRPLLQRLFAGIEAAGLPGDRLVIEVTEETFMTDPEHARETVHELRDHGLQVSIDDYGTGFSSLAYLRDLPVHELKMDRSFIARIAEDERSRMIVQTTTQMARALGLRMVAEGVEDAASAAALLPLGVDIFQGYHIARPMPRDRVGPWTLQWTDRLTVGTGLPPRPSGT
jgi:diguanylate cyclase (GGDEF)-like protein